MMVSNQIMKFYYGFLIVYIFYRYKNVKIYSMVRFKILILYVGVINWYCFGVLVMDKVGIMLLHEEEWMQEGNSFYFKGSKGKAIEVSMAILYEDLLEMIYRILKLDPKSCSVSMKYVFFVNIPTCPIKVTDDRDVKFFIGLNSTSGKLHVPLCITIENRIENDTHKSFSNSYHEFHMSFEIDKELDENLMIMQKRRHNHYELVENFDVQGEGGSRCHNEPLERYNGHDWNMNEFTIHEEDDTVDINLINGEPVIIFDFFKTNLAQSLQIQTSIDIDDTLLHDNSTIVEDV